MTIYKFIPLGISLNSWPLLLQHTVLADLSYNMAEVYTWESINYCPENQSVLS